MAPARGSFPLRTALTSIEGKMNLHDPRFVYGRNLLHEPELWRRTGEIAVALDILKRIATDRTETPDTRASAEILMKQLCKAGRPPTGTYG